MSADRLANSFEVVAREWFTKYSSTWASHHAERIMRRFERDLLKWTPSPGRFPPEFKLVSPRHRSGLALPQVAVHSADSAES
jgi:hypothetical protein